MDAPAGGTPAEDAAFRAGMVHARLGALEIHATTVTAAIETTADTLAALVLSVNELRLTIKMLEIGELTARVTALETVESSAKSVRSYRRWLIATVLAAAAILVTLITTSLPHLH